MVALTSDGGNKVLSQPQPDLDAVAVSSRLRPEVPNFDFSNRKNNERGPCTRCGSTVELKHAFCPQCGASLVSANSPIADAAHNSIFPEHADRIRLSPSAEQGSFEPNVPVTSFSKCRHCGVSVIDSASNCPQCGLRMKVSEPTGPICSNDGAYADSAGTGEVSTVRPPTSISEVQQSRAGVQSAASTRRLVMLAQDGSIQRVIPLLGERIDLGGREGEILLPDDGLLSARHARFTGRDGVRTLVDLDSLNGIYLRIRGIASLSDGDMFLVGLQLLEFRRELPEMANLMPIRIAGCSLFGSSTSPRYARLSERTSDGAPRSVFIVGRDETILGREVGDIVFSGDPFMSRRHAALTRDPTDGNFTLRDLGSSNGTFLRVRGKVDLEPGDHLRIGQHLFRYEMDIP